MTLFTPTPDIFNDETVLRHNTYTPDKIIGRDEELENYQYALQPVINGAPPKHIIVNGKPGTGKTAMTNYLLSHLEADAKTYNIDITSVYINCNGDTSGTSSYTIAIEIINKLRAKRNSNTGEMSATGHPTKKVFNTLIDELNATGGTTLIVLDEIHQLNDEKLLYYIPRAPTSTHLNDDTHVGLIGISNIPSLFDTLSLDVNDTLDPETIHLGAYSSEELAQILEARADDAFQADAIDTDVIRWCAAKVADTGNARRAITLVREAGEVARNKNETPVTKEHVEAALEKLETNHVLDAIRSLTMPQESVLLTVAFENREDLDVETPTKELYDTYTRFLDTAGYPTKSLNTFSNRLKDLEQQELITRNQTYSGGRQNKYKLAVDPVLVLEAITDEFYDSILSPILYDGIKHGLFGTDEVEHLPIYEKRQEHHGDV